MSAVFLDTSYLLALTLSDDELHDRAVRWERVVTDPVITTEWVLVEFMDALAEPSLRGKADRAVQALKQSAAVEIAPSSPGLFEAGRSLYIQHQDKSWGLTDCISFAVMRSRDVNDALTYDRHYEQAGFRALLRAEP